MLGYFSSVNGKNQTKLKEKFEVHHDEEVVHNGEDIRHDEVVACHGEEEAE